jgi:hypothetical protein
MLKIDNMESQSIIEPDPLLILLFVVKTKGIYIRGMIIK